MKKLFAILLLAVHLFNLGGYNLVFQHLIANADVQADKYLDDNCYKEKDLVEVKVPLNMPYLKATNNFERIKGQIELGGIQYNYVKRKISGDTLYILCYPNLAKTKFSNEKADYAKQNAEVPSGKKDTESPLKKLNLCSDYNMMNESFSFTVPLSYSALKDNFVCPEIFSVFIKAPAQPPDSSC